MVGDCGGGADGQGGLKSVRRCRKLPWFIRHATSVVVLVRSPCRGDTHFNRTERDDRGFNFSGLSSLGSLADIIKKRVILTCFKHYLVNNNSI
jgi:hypothetical protein